MGESHVKSGGGNGGPIASAEAKRLSTTELVGLIAGRATLLAEKQVELAKAEFRANLRAEIRMVVGLAIAAACGIVAISLLLVAATFALAAKMPAWLAALILAAGMLLLGAVAGLLGWGMRVRSPLAMTRATLKDNLRWAKERLVGGAS